MFDVIAACGKVFTHTDVSSMTKGGCVFLVCGLVPADRICTGVVGVVSADIEKFLHQCICALSDPIYAKRRTYF